ncbi:hypothetical protein [Novosphingobium sp. Rr 2-17]|uniref:hypothetical protein n=1 Tax=Novosphingobium sp. Rr 2-17 TaxID=555793 RepID=UPI001ED8F61C|nr:hypothetical protein [Novosphingobium sp. Rr 2-17]
MNAIIEAVEHDNSVADADQAPESSPLDVIDYGQRESITVKEAVDWANSQRCPITLYLYDDGAGTASEGHFNEVANRMD